MLNPRYVLLRHGETSWDSLKPSQNRINGWSSEGLDAEGVSQVEEALPTLREAGITHILSSDLERAEETAKIVGEDLQVPVASEYGLRCWFLGMYAGQLESVVKPLVDFFVAHPDTTVPHGESFNSWMGRLDYTNIKIKSFALRHPESCLLVVTHGSCIEHIISEATGKSGGPLASFPPAGVFNLMFNGHSWLGETPHALQKRH